MSVAEVERASSGLHKIARRLLANVDAERGDHASEMLNIPASYYVDQARFEHEVDAIFHRRPLLVALSCDIREPGSFSALTIAGRPLLVTRGDDGVARTFLNICRHRGAKVTPDCFGSARRFTCPYHFWTYDTRGSLVGTTAREAFEGHGLMVSRIMPGTTADRCTVEQFQYFRKPMETPEEISAADAKRELYFQVTRDEDFATVKEVTVAAAAIGTDVFRFGRNELGNQNLHRSIMTMTTGCS